MKVYLIVLIIIVLFYLFLSANCGNSIETDKKIYYLNKLPQQWVIPFTTVNKNNLREKPIRYPIVFKPNRCTGCGVGVQRIDSEIEALEYLENTTETETIAQTLDTRPKEYSVLYEKHPVSKQGHVISVTEKIPVKPNSHFNTYNVGIGERKSYVIDHTDRLTPEFNGLIDYITGFIPEFYVGRYDVKAENLQELLKGNFGILELNGLFGVDHKSYINTTNELDLKNILNQSRWFSKRVLVGLENNLVHGPSKIIKNLKKEKLECPEHKEKIWEAISNMKILIVIVLIFIINLFRK